MPPGGVHPIAYGSTIERPRCLGLSPRGRGSQHLRKPGVVAPGSIPAWAGEPAPSPRRGARLGVYPRVGGGAVGRVGFEPTGAGLSPRGRGSLARILDDGSLMGSIPACVDAPLDASGNLGTVGHVIRCGRVSGLEDAACHAPRACMEICRSGPVRLPALGRAAFAMMVLPTRSLDRLPLRSLAPSHIRRQADDKGL